MLYDVEFQEKIFPSRQLHVTHRIKSRNFSRVTGLYLTKILQISNISVSSPLVSNISFLKGLSLKLLETRYSFDFIMKKFQSL